MYQRGEPDASDAHMSCVYGLALPLVSQGIPLRMVQLERILQPGYLDDMRILLLSYDGMKPPTESIHYTLADWVKRGGVLVFVGQGDSYNTVRSWWNTEECSLNAPHEHLFQLLGASNDSTTSIGDGWLVTVPESPTTLAYAPTGAQTVRDVVQKAASRFHLDVLAHPAFVLRRGPYVIAAGVIDTEAEEPVQLPGCYVNLFDAGLSIVRNPLIAGNSYWLLYDLDSLDMHTAWVIAASGRVDDEVTIANSLSFTISGAQDTTGVVRLRLPAAPQMIQVRCDDQQVEALHEWDAESQTLLLSFPAQSQGNHIQILFSTQEHSF
jgi:hypothetical protein